MGGSGVRLRRANSSGKIYWVLAVALAIALVTVPSVVSAVSVERRTPLGADVDARPTVDDAPTRSLGQVALATGDWPSVLDGETTFDVEIRVLSKDTADSINSQRQMTFHRNAERSSFVSLSGWEISIDESTNRVWIETPEGQSYVAVQFPTAADRRPEIPTLTLVNGPIGLIAERYRTIMDGPHHSEWPTSASPASPVAPVTLDEFQEYLDISDGEGLNDSSSSSGDSQSTYWGASGECYTASGDGPQGRIELTPTGVTHPSLHDLHEDAIETVDVLRYFIEQGTVDCEGYVEVHLEIGGQYLQICADGDQLYIEDQERCPPSQNSDPTGDDDTSLGEFLEPLEANVASDKLQLSQASSCSGGFEKRKTTTSRHTRSSTGILIAHQTIETSRTDTGFSYDYWYSCDVAASALVGGSSGIWRHVGVLVRFGSQIEEGGESSSNWVPAGEAEYVVCQYNGLVFSDNCEGTWTSTMIDAIVSSGQNSPYLPTKLQICPRNEVEGPLGVKIPTAFAFNRANHTHSQAVHSVTSRLGFDYDVQQQIRTSSSCINEVIDWESA